MTEHLNQKLSQFLDNELDPVEALSLLKNLHNSPGLQDKYNRYQTIGQVIKANKVSVANTDFITQINKQLQHEPVYLLPIKTAPKKLYKQMAIAASIVMIAVITSYNFAGSMQQFAAESGFKMAQVQQNEPAHDAAKAIEYPLNKQINDYLQAHNMKNVDNEQSYQPYARVSSYNQK
jgi:negative regulator of sigma E activity